MCYIPSHEKQQDPIFVGRSSGTLNAGLGGNVVILLLDLPTILKDSNALESIVCREDILILELLLDLQPRLTCLIHIPQSKANYLILDCRRKAGLIFGVKSFLLLKLAKITHETSLYTHQH